MISPYMYIIYFDQIHPLLFFLIPLTPFICYTKGFHRDISINAHNVLLLLFSFLPLFKKNFKRFHYSTFIHINEIFWPYSLRPSPLPFTHMNIHPAVISHPQTKPVLHSFHSFLRTRFLTWKRTYDILNFVRLDYYS
jgi:hypothetical protein